MDTQLTDFPGEQWKAILGYEQQYQLSNYGRLKSLSCIVKNRKTSYPKPDRILKLGIRLLDDTILLQMKLKKPGSGEKVGLSVSRYVYSLFVAHFDFLNNSIRVKRKDNDPLNLYYENFYLEEVGIAYREPVNQYDENGIFIHQHISMAETAKASGSTIGAIRNALLSKNLQDGKYFWRRGEPHDRIDIPKRKIPNNQGGKARARVVQKLTLDGTPLEIYTSIADAVRKLGYKKSYGIQRACANENYSFLGYRWCYFDIPPGSAAIEPFGNNIASTYGFPVNQYNINGIFIQTYPSASEAAKETGFHMREILRAVSMKTIVKGYFWTRGNPESFDISGFAVQIEAHLKIRKKVVQKFTTDGQLLETFESIYAAANAIGVTADSFSTSLKKPNRIYKGFRWHYVD